MEEKIKLKDLTPTKVSSEDFQEEILQREIITEYDPYPEMEESEDEDIVNGSYIRYEDFGPHRQRSNTAQWLDKKEQALKKAAKIKVIKWEDPPMRLTDEERAQVFAKKDLSMKQVLEVKKSLLTDQLEKCPHLPHRQYLDIEHPDISLGSAHNYGLCIAEDDGEVDWAFPCLDANEPCSKFGFTCLGLIDLKSKNAIAHTTSSIPEEGGWSGAFQIIFPKITDSGQSQANQSRHNTGGSSTSEAVLNAIQAVNEDKRSSNSKDPDLDKIHSHIMATEAPQYKAYRVQLLHKVRANTPVQLGVSLDRIEVVPLQSGTHKFWPRTKYFSHSIDKMAWCQIMEAKSNKTLFRLVYSPAHGNVYNDANMSSHSSFFNPNTAFKHHDFECDHDTAKEIVEKVNRILELKNSPCRREYKTAKEKKLQTRRSFHNPKHITCS
ncbi:Target of rapamycin complex 2 subunit MAPKAP1 [Eumeta japonica]|uniref:Target of rapamycin complex 2 subunit MAPKAP1 n=1 Tax=Eumeta variegata TaxID=151549 RepID=A0A4C1UPR5_EUMVA|nr:Target of rapamycin complex 2 subunit MAPKAP1 [Eumeta japonica]